MNWLEISLTLDGEMAEAVADVLARHVPEGVSIESTQIESNPDDEGRPIGPLRVRAFLPADDAAVLEVARNQIEQDLFYLGMIQPIPQPTYTPVAEADWAELWKANYHPIRVGRRLEIVPAWLADSPAPNSPASLPILMDPGMAFGTGTHPTTQLCLAMLEDYLKPGDSVLDVGCGSGILSVAAAKLGAGRLLGVDIDPEADRATHENAALNGVSDRIEFRLGSIEIVLKDQLSVISDQSPTANDQLPTTSHQPPTTSYQIVLANILARVIINLLNDGLAHTVAPGGTLILSGILIEQAEQVLTAVKAADLQVIEQRQSGDWVAIAVRHT